MAKSFTGRGDDGNTRNFSGTVFSKGDRYVEVVGKIDELQSAIDFAKIYNSENKYLTECLEKINSELWQLAGLIAEYSKGTFDVEKVNELEKMIEGFGEPPRNFVRFQNLKSASLNEARVRSRALEREFVRYSQENESVDKNIISYLNRLSSFFFMAGYSEK